MLFVLLSRGLNCSKTDAKNHLCSTNILWKRKALGESSSQWTTGLLLLCNTHVCQAKLSPFPSCKFSITEWLGLRDDGWGQSEALSLLLLRPACHGHAPQRPSILHDEKLSDPASNNATALQTKEEISMREGDGAGEKENKLFTLTSNVPQRVVKRKRWASVLPVWAPTDGKSAPGRGESARGGWANAQGRKERITSSSSWFHLIYVTTLKTMGTNKITEDHFGSK